MGFIVEKGDSAHKRDAMQRIHIACHWHPVSGNRIPFDLDCHAFGLMYRKGDPARATLYRTKFGSYPHALTYANDELKRIPGIGLDGFQTQDGSMIHLGDSLHGDSSAYDEEIYINLDVLPSRIDEVAIWVSVNTAPKGKEVFRYIDGAFVTVMDAFTGNELCRFPLNEKFPGSRSAHVCSLVRIKKKKWTFSPIGIGLNTPLSDILEVYQQKGKKLQRDDEVDHFGHSEIQIRTLNQFRGREHGFSNGFFPITEEELTFTDPDAPKEVIDEAIIIAQSFSSTDPESRFAMFGVDLQKDYGQMMDETLKLQHHRRFGWTRSALEKLLTLIESVDFSELTDPPQKPWYHFFSNFMTGAPRPTLTCARIQEVVKEVNKKETQLQNHLVKLQELRNTVATLNQRRDALLRSMEAHALAGDELSIHLSGQRKIALDTRVLSLRTSHLTGTGMEQGTLQLKVLDGMIHAIKDTLLTWVPIWVSTANEVVSLLKAGTLDAANEHLVRATDARAHILSEKHILDAM